MLDWLIRRTRLFRRTQEELDYYRKTFLSRQGFLLGYGNYSLMSLDGGYNWYAVERNDKQVKVLGEAEEVFPGLMAQMMGLKRLFDLIEEKGPLNIGDPDDRRVLEAAGFGFHERKPQA